MTNGIIGLAVPGSSAFAGEFAILAGVFTRGWGYSVVGAVAIVLAAMYMLRLISAVLHERAGPAVAPEALDLRPAELGAIVPLLACLLALSVWPAAITERSFTGDRAGSAIANQLAVAPAPSVVTISVSKGTTESVEGSDQSSIADCLRKYRRALNNGHYATASGLLESC
jgi:NADH:ubiquinone oxidoreductase subunit 4 (subunit M)